MLFHHAASATLCRCITSVVSGALTQWNSLCSGAWEKKRRRRRRSGVLTFWLLVDLSEHAPVPVFGFVDTLMKEKKGGAESE